MAISTQTQNLNLIPGKSAPVVVHLSQGNVGNTVQFYLYDGDNPYYPTNVSIAVHGVRADNTVFGPYAVSATSGSNLVSFTIVSAMASVNGAAIGELVITDSGQNQIGSANFGMLVEETPYSSSVTYEDDLSIYQRILAYVQSIPASISGQIATEAEIRTEMDASIRSALNTEISERKSADTSLSNSINSEASTRATADANLQSQINQIVVPSGEAPSAAEVQNARIGADNVTYSTLGDAIRSQVTDLRSALNVNSELLFSEYYRRNEDRTNLFNKFDNITQGGVLMHNTGRYYRFDGMCYSDYVPVSSNTIYTVNHVNVHICFYSSNKEYLSGKSVGSTSSMFFTTPSNCAYLRISCNTSDLDDFQLQTGDTATSYVPYFVSEITRKEFSLSKLKRNFSKINILNPLNVTKGGVISGYSGKFIELDTAFYSDRIPVVGGKNYAFAQYGQISGFNKHYAFFDENMNYLSGSGDASREKIGFSAPADASYLIVSGVVDFLDTSLVYPMNSNNYSPDAEEFEPYYINIGFNEKRFSQKKICIIGDSISYGVGATDYTTDRASILQSYANKFAGMTDCELTNLAISGATISSQSGISSFIRNQIPNIPNDTEYIIIFGGTNDYWLQVAIGDANSTDVGTFNGALNSIFTTVPAQHPSAKLVFITPYKQWRNDITIDGISKDSDGGYGTSIDLGQGTMKAYRDAIIDKCEKYSIPVLDLCSILQSPEFAPYRGMYTDNGDVHPNNNGHTAIAYLLYNYMINNVP